MVINHRIVPWNGAPFCLCIELQKKGASFTGVSLPLFQALALEIGGKCLLHGVFVHVNIAVMVFPLSELRLRHCTTPHC